MSSRIKKMTEGTPWKLILAFSMPLMLGNVFQQMYTIVDTMVVGRFLGVNALAALGADDWFSWMMLGIVQGFTQGFAIKMAQDFGAGNEAALKKTIGNSTVIAILFSLFLTLLGELAVIPGLKLLQTQEAVFADAEIYLRLIFAGTPVIMLYNLFASVLRSLGDSKTPLHAMIVASLTNIGLDLLFVIVFKWGIAGAALGTVCAQFVSILYCLWHMRKMELLHLQRSDYRLELKLGGHLLYLGLPMAFQNAIIAVGGMIVQSVVNRFSVAFIAGVTAVNKLYGLLEIAGTSYGYAMVTYTGQNLGAGKLNRIRQGVRSALLIALITSVTIGVLMLVFGESIVSIFISGTREQVAEAVRVGYKYLAIMGTFLPILYFLHVVRSTIQGLGNTVLPMVSGIAEFFMRISMVLFCTILGEGRIFFAEVAAWTGSDLVLIPSYLILMRRLCKKEEA